MLKKIKQFFIKNKQQKNAETIIVQVGNYSLTAPYGHPIEHHLKEFKYYSRNVPRIAKYIEEKYPSYTIVDIGANIGDTIALLRTDGVNQNIYAIEGEPSFYALLEKNIQQFTNVKTIQKFLGEQTGMEKLTFEQEEGTAKLSKNDKKAIEIQKLDDLLSNVENVKFLKIDTDGFDLKILRGAFEIIKINKPILFFEYDAFYLDQLGDDGLSIFEQLLELGYTKILYYDNYGKFLVSISTSDKTLIQQLYVYMRNQDGAFPYFDVCVVNEQDKELGEKIIHKETLFFN